MEFHFGNLSADGDIEEHWQILLYINAPFEIIVGGAVWYRETDFPVVEFAACIADWQSAGGDLNYTSIESEDDPLIAFNRTAGGDLLFHSPHAIKVISPRVTREMLERAADQFVTRLKMEVLRSFNVEISRVLSEHPAG